MFNFIIIHLNIIGTMASDHHTDSKGLECKGGVMGSASS